MEEEAEKLKKLQSQVDQEMSNTPVLSSANSSKTSMYIEVYTMIFYFFESILLKYKIMFFKNLLFS